MTEPVLMTIAALLDNAIIDEDKMTVRGVRQGQTITFERTLWGKGSVQSKWTEITVGYPPARQKMGLLVRPRTPDLENEFELGLATHHPTEDAIFDQEFILEGAPKRAVLAIFDEKARRGVLAFKPDSIATMADGIVVRRGIWEENPQALALHIELAVMIGMSAAHFALADLESVKQERAALSYREVSTEPPERYEVDEAEIGQYLAKQIDRRAHERRLARVMALQIGAALLGVIAVLILLALAYLGFAEG